MELMYTCSRNIKHNNKNNNNERLYECANFGHSVFE
jgi:hypothetical protein